MAKRNDSAPSEKTIVNVSSYTEKARPVADVTEHWFGISPSEVQEGLTSQALPQRDIDDFCGEEITVLGFQNRTGKIRGKETSYKIIMAAGDNGEAFVFITGAQVINRKLQDCADREALPVRGRIEHKKGADFSYYDFTA